MNDNESTRVARLCNGPLDGIGITLSTYEFPSVLYVRVPCIVDKLLCEEAPVTATYTTVYQRCYDWRAEDYFYFHID